MPCGFPGSEKDHSLAQWILLLDRSVALSQKKVIMTKQPLHFLTGVLEPSWVKCFFQECFFMDKVKLENARSFSARGEGVRWDGETGNFIIKLALFDSVK